MQLILSEDWRYDEPLAYLVKCLDTATHEYMVFADADVARRFADEQAYSAAEAGEPDDWLVYPLYAGRPS